MSPNDGPVGLVEKCAGLCNSRICPALTCERVFAGQEGGPAPGRGAQLAKPEYGFAELAVQRNKLYLGIWRQLAVLHARTDLYAHVGNTFPPALKALERRPVAVNRVNAPAVLVSPARIGKHGIDGKRRQLQ